VTGERKRYDGTLIRQADCIVGDQFGCVKFLAKNEQIDFFKPGSVVTLRNAFSRVFNEHMRVEVDKWGKIEPSTENVD
jgi:replication factor A1